LAVVGYGLISAMQHFVTIATLPANAAADDVQKLSKRLLSGGYTRNRNPLAMSRRPRYEIEIQHNVKEQ
jgi:hypothetical protein